MAVGRTIPTSADPWVCTINGKKYSYAAGSTETVPNEVAAVIDNEKKLQPALNPIAGKTSVKLDPMELMSASFEQLKAIYDNLVNGTEYFIYQQLESGAIQYNKILCAECNDQTKSFMVTYVSGGDIYKIEYNNGTFSPKICPLTFTPVG